MEKTKASMPIYFSNAERGSIFGKNNSTLENNIKRMLEDIIVRVDWIQLSQEAHINTVINIQTP
jgi:hypothetical protein